MFLDFPPNNNSIYNYQLLYFLYDIPRPSMTSKKIYCPIPEPTGVPTNAKGHLVKLSHTMRPFREALGEHALFYHLSRGEFKIVNFKPSPSRSAKSLR